MKKVVKKIGASLVFILDREDKHIFDLQEGDIVDLGDIVNISAQTRKENKEVLENGN